MIGYNPGVVRQEAKWALISLEDGMISHSDKTREQLADALNTGRDYPVELFPAVKHSQEYER